MNETKKDIIIDKELLFLVKVYTQIEGQTIIHCNYTAPSKYQNGGWVNIFPTTYLLDHISGNRYHLLSAINVPLAPDKYYFSKAGQAKIFTLIFPALPKSCLVFSLHEETENGKGFTARNISKNEIGIYQITIY